MTPYFASAGPLDGPTGPRDRVPGAIGVMHPADEPMPIGVAFLHGRIESPRGPVSTFRLTVGKVDLPGLYVLDSRQFIPLERWTPRPARSPAARSAGMTPPNPLGSSKTCRWPS